MPIRWNPNTGQQEEYDNSGALNISGYGRKMAVESGPGTGEYTDEWGESVSPEYVQDIDKTIGQFDAGQITEGQLREKGGMPRKPSDDELSMFDQWDSFYKSVKPQIESEAEKRADEAKTRVNQSFYGVMANSDIALLKPEKHAEVNSKAMDAYQKTFQHVFDRETTLARSAFEKEFAKVEATRKAQQLKAQRLVPNYDTGYMERMNTVTGEREITDLPVKPKAENTQNATSIISALEKALPPNADVGDAYAAYLQYVKDGYDPATALRHTIQYTKGNVVGTATGGKESALYEDLIKNGRSPEQANAYIAKAKKLGKL